MQTTMIIVALVAAAILIFWPRNRSANKCRWCNGTGIAEGGYDCGPCGGSGKQDS